jgi:hypothetical protein
MHCAQTIICGYEHVDMSFFDDKLQGSNPEGWHACHVCYTI